MVCDPIGLDGRPIYRVGRIALPARIRHVEGWLLWRAGLAALLRAAVFEGLLRRRGSCEDGTVFVARFV